MREGDITHEEVDAAIAAASKTIIFGRQNRLREGILLEDEKLPRFHAGHDKVKFFYSAVRQLPAYFLDALLAKDISVTLVLGRGLLCFKDVRNYQALHIGRTRRTIYLPEQILDVAARKGYDYWAITQILVCEGWKLLDFVLLLELVEEARQLAAERATSVMGYTTLRRILRQNNRHRSSYESPVLQKQKERFRLDVPINEMEEFIDLYEPRFLKAVRFKGNSPDRTPGAILRQTSADELAKRLYDEYQEDLWAERKTAEVFEEQHFPEFFLLDRDIVHPAARELAEAGSQDIRPRNMDEARHDYRDTMRFGIGREAGIEELIHQAAHFGPEGINGLLEEIVSPLFTAGKIDEKLLDWAQNILGPLASKRPNLFTYLERGIRLVRFCQVLRFHDAVRSGERRLHLEDVEFLRRLLLALAAAKAQTGDLQRLDLIEALQDVREMVGQLKALLVGEAGQLLDRHVSAGEVEPPTILQDIGAELEAAVVRVTLSLDQVSGYPAIVEQLAARGERARAVMAEYLAEVARQSEDQVVEQQVIVVQAQRALEAWKGQPEETAAEEGHPDREILGDIVRRVDHILEMLPPKIYEWTSGSRTGVRRALREVQKLRQRHPTDPDQLALLAMLLVQLDRTERYPEFLDQIRWMKHYAVGRLLTGATPGYTPGLLRVIDQVGPDSDPIGRNAVALVKELTGKEDLSVFRLC